MPSTLDATTTTSTFDIGNFTKNAKIVQSTDIEDQRTWEVKGDGNFDKLMEVTRKHLDSLLKSRCITKEEYPALYVDMMKTNLQIVLLAEEKGYDNALKKRQIQGYNESFKKDILKILIDGWTVGFSASEETFYDAKDSEKIIPDPLKSNKINDLYNNYIINEYDEGISYTKSDTVSAS